jgi:hypothetical protein
VRRNKRYIALQQLVTQHFLCLSINNLINLRIWAVDLVELVNPVDAKATEVAALVAVTD